MLALEISILSQHQENVAPVTKNQGFYRKKIEKLANGEKSGFFDSVVFNSAAALTISEQAKNLQDGVRIAADTLLAGKTKELIKNLKGSNTSLK